MRKAITRCMKWILLDYDEDAYSDIQIFFFVAGIVLLGGFLLILW